MTVRTIYLLLAVVGAVVPYAFFLDFFSEHVLLAFVPALFVNGAAGGFSADLVISSLVFWVFAFAEAQRIGLARPWLYVVLNLTVGLSCALPLFMWSRARAMGESIAVNP